MQPHRSRAVRRGVVIASVICTLATAGLATAKLAARSGSSEQQAAGLAPVWTTKLPAPPVGRPAHDSQRVYVLLRSGQLVAVALESGAIQWSVEVEALPALAAGEGLVFLAAPAALEARAGSDGSVRWHTSIDGEVTGALVWDDGWLLTVTSRGTLFAIRARDGQVIWKRPAGTTASAAPALAADRAYFALADSRVQARRLRTGDLVWERKLGGAPSELLPLDDRVFVGAADHFFYCLAIKNGTVRWRWRAGGAIVGAPIVDTKSVYFASLDNVLRALDRRNGHQRWRQLLATRPSGGPLPFDRNMLAVAGIAAEVRAYRAADGSLVATVATPAELAAPLSAVTPSSRSLTLLIVVTLDGQLQGLALAPIGHPIKGLPQYLPLPGMPGMPEPSS
jgi:outer membrane protein assembly factor BamB